MATQTKNAQSDDQQTSGPRSRPNGQPTYDAADQITEPARIAVAKVTEAVEQVGRQGQDGVLRSMQLWTDMMTRTNPLAWFGTPSGDQIAPVRAAMDSGFEMVEALLATQRRCVDQVLIAQRRLVGSFLENAAKAGALRGDSTGVRDRTDA